MLSALFIQQFHADLFSLTLYHCLCASMCIPAGLFHLGWCATAHLKFIRCVFPTVNVKFEISISMINRIGYLSGCITTATATNLNFQLINVDCERSSHCLLSALKLLLFCWLIQKKVLVAFQISMPMAAAIICFFICAMSNAYAHNRLMPTTGLYGKLTFFIYREKQQQIGWEKSKSNRFIERVTS